MSFSFRCASNIAGSLTLHLMKGLSARMGIGEDEFLVPKQSLFGAVGSSDGRRQQPGLRKLLQPLAVALGIFGVSAGAARYLFPRKKIQPQQQMLQTPGQHDMLYGADSSPTTAVCAASEQIVMKGADLTSYFSLEHGGSPVFGVAEHETIYNGYRFWFASEENKAKFQVRAGAAVGCVVAVQSVPRRRIRGAWPRCR